MAVIYPASGKKERTGKLGTLKSVSPRIAWVVFPWSAKVDSVRRFDLSKGYVVARVVGAQTRVRF